MEIKECRICKNQIKKVLALGEFPVVNVFLASKDIKSEKKYPLDLYFCFNCNLAQLGFILSAEKMFRKYHYASSASIPLSMHLGDLAKDCQVEFNVNKVLDIGSNDGSFLSNFKNSKLVLGVEPARTISKLAEKRGIKTINEFFNSKLARKISEKFGKFGLISVTHTLANIIDLHDFISGVDLLLDNDGVFVIEVGSLKEMLEKGQFDALYHEHYSYFCFKSLEYLLRAHNLTIFRVEKNSFHGGSIRIFAKHGKKDVKKASLREHISSADFSNFEAGIKAKRKEMRNLFTKLRGLRVVGFGAPAKSVTFLNYCGIGKSQVEFIIDSTPFKHGKFLPGAHIPIYPEEYLKKQKADYCLILAWNYRDYLLNKLKKITNKPMSVIIPFPKLEIYDLT